MLWFFLLGCGSSNPQESTEVTIDPNRFTIRGMITDTAGSPLPGSQIVATHILAAAPTPKISASMDSTVFTLFTGIPNPFFNLVQIPFELPGRSQVLLEVFDLDGERVRHLIQDEYSSPLNTILFNSLNDAGEFLPIGMYTVRMTIAELSQEVTILRTGIILATADETGSYKAVNLIHPTGRITTAVDGLGQVQGDIIVTNALEIVAIADGYIPSRRIITADAGQHEENFTLSLVNP